MDDLRKLNADELTGLGVKLMHRKTIIEKMHIRKPAPTQASPVSPTASPSSPHSDVSHWFVRVAHSLFVASGCADGQSRAAAR